MKEIQLYTHLIYNISGMINKLKMKDIQLENGVKLNSAAMSMLNVIDMNPGMSVTDLSIRMNQTKSAVSQMLKKLCTLKLIEKNKNNCNEKNVYPELTEIGKTTVAEYREKHDSFYLCMTDLLNRYDSDGQEFIYRFLTEADQAIRTFSSSIEVTMKPKKAKENDI